MVDELLALAKFTACAKCTLGVIYLGKYSQTCSFSEQRLVLHSLPREVASPISTQWCEVVTKTLWSTLCPLSNKSCVWLGPASHADILGSSPIGQLIRSSTSCVPKIAPKRFLHTGISNGSDARAPPLFLGSTTSPGAFIFADILVIDPSSFRAFDTSGHLRDSRGVISKMCTCSTRIRSTATIDHDQQGQYHANPFILANLDPSTMHQ
jgi:hypothetical protein